MQSKLTKHQVRTFGPVPYKAPGYSADATITAEVRYDDRCSNGHNTFSITAEIVDTRGGWSSGGTQHDAVAAAFPELAPFIKFHLVSSDQPMHYLANTLYWLGYDVRWCDGKASSPPKLEHARSTAVWPDMPETLLCSVDVHDRYHLTDEEKDAIAVGREAVKKALTERLESVQSEFRTAVESLGFTF